MSPSVGPFPDAPGPCPPPGLLSGRLGTRSYQKSVVSIRDDK